MRAVRCLAYGPLDRLVVQDLPSPEPGPGQVRVRVKAAGVNYPDALLVQGRHQYRPELPLTPGGEFAGVVTSLGPGVGGVEVGQAVYGSRTRGAFAEEIAIDADKLLAVPDGMAFEQAAALSTTYNTAYYGLAILGTLRAGETVLVLGGAGGVGLAAIEVAKGLGARVIAAASSPEKLAVCAQHGADALIDYARDDLRERLKALAPGGVDVVVDPVGGPLAEPALRSLAWRGRFLVVGFASGEIPRPALNLVLLKGVSVIGVFLGETWTRERHVASQIDAGMSALMRAGAIRPRVAATYPLERTAQALQALLDRKAMGKLVVVP